jgi:hypothetical protein
MACGQCGSLSIGASPILNLVAHMPGRTILDILRANRAVNSSVLIILLGVGALTLPRYDVQPVPTWIGFGRFVPGALLLGYRDKHL